MILRSLFFYFQLWLSTVLLSIVFLPSAMVWSFVFQFPLGQLDSSLYHVFTISVLLIWLHIFAIIFDSDYRSSYGLKYLALSSSLTSFIVIFGSKHSTIFLDTVGFAVIQNIGVLAITHGIPMLVLHSGESTEDSDEEITYTEEESAGQGNEKGESMAEFEQWMNENSQVDDLER